MTVLARTNSDEKATRVLVCFWLKSQGETVKKPFPMDGMSGSEIEVLGYRGMKEYEIALDNIKVSKENLSRRKRRYGLLNS